MRGDWVQPKVGSDTATSIGRRYDLPQMPARCNKSPTSCLHMTVVPESGPGAGPMPWDPRMAQRGCGSMERWLMKAEEVAGMLSLSRAQVFQLARRGVIPSIRIGRSVRFPAEALRDWLGRQVDEASDMGAPTRW